MGKPGFGIFQARRKSQSNALEDADPSVYLNPAPSTESGGFRVLNRADIERAKQEQAAKKKEEKTSKFGRFSTFGASGNKGRTQSIDEDSPSSSKRDSKSSSGTQSFMSRQYHPGGSSSTLPSSAESDPNDNNLFSNLPPRPHPVQQSSSPGNMSMGQVRQNLPPVPYPTRAYTADDPMASGSGGRARALTTSSYASTAVAPKLDSELDFGDAGFDNMFSGLDRKESPELKSASPGQSGRSLLQGRRTFQSEPIRIDPQLEVEPPLQSWDSRGSEDNLMGSPDGDRSPPPVPAHKFSQYAPVAMHSPDLNGSDGFEDEDAKLVRQSTQHRKSIHEISVPNGSLSPTAASHSITPRTARTATTPSSEREDDDNMFGSPNSRKTAVRKPSMPILKENIPPPQLSNGNAPRRVMTAAEFQAHQRLQASAPADDSSDGEDYDDEEEAIRKREEELKAIRQRQQLQIAREHMRRSTAPGLPNAVNGVPALSNGFPSETSMQADEWSDEDVPLGVLAQHGFPGRDKAPTQPPNATPSYYMPSSPQVPERPASTGAMGNRASTYRPPFARNLPDDPYATMGGNGLVRQPIRESMGFNRAASVYNDSTGAIPYDAQPQFTSLVDQIQMRDNAKQKYMGGASAKKPAGGPFTGSLSGHMNANGQDRSSTRMSMMPGMNGMPGMNPMMNMMGGGMPMMGMNQMPYPMYPQNELMMQQMYQQMLQMQAQQNAMFGQPGQPHDPRMSMFPQQQAHDPRMSMFPQQQAQDPRMSMFPQAQNNSFLNVGAGGNPQRPMSIMSVGVGHQSSPNLQNRPYSTLGPPGMQPTAGYPSPQLGTQMNNGYSPSIAPSERSNIGLSARYRPVVTGNGMNDTQSTVGSSMTILQASGGAAEASTAANNANANGGKKVKGILKNKAIVPQVTVRDDDDDDWGKMAARKSKFLGLGSKKKKKEESDGLSELVRGVDAL